MKKLLFLLFLAICCDNPVETRSKNSTPIEENKPPSHPEVFQVTLSNDTTLIGQWGDQKTGVELIFEDTNFVMTQKKGIVYDDGVWKTKNWKNVRFKLYLWFNSYFDDWERCTLVVNYKIKDIDTLIIYDTKYVRSK